jgi:transcriptional regulator with XRE-family HTH domain
MNAPKTEEFNALEARIEQQGVRIAKLLDAFRSLLLRLIAEGRFGTILPADLDRISDYLRLPEEFLQPKQEVDMEKIRNELWTLADANQAKNPDLYYLVRCSILIYGKADEWDTAQDPLIYYCVSFLDRIIPDIEAEFVKHFNRVIFKI